MTPGLLAAAQAVIDAGAGYDEERQRLGYEDQSIALVIHRSAVDALRAELAAATAGPVALTGEDEFALGNAVYNAYHASGRGAPSSHAQALHWRSETILSALEERGYSLVRRPS